MTFRRDDRPLAGLIAGFAFTLIAPYAVLAQLPNTGPPLSSGSGAGTGTGASGGVAGNSTGTGLEGGAAGGTTGTGTQSGSGPGRVRGGLGPYRPRGGGVLSNNPPQGAIPYGPGIDTNFPGGASSMPIDVLIGPGSPKASELTTVTDVQLHY